MGLEGELNLYIDVEINPINTTDPTGLNPLLLSSISTVGTANASALALYSNQIGQELYSFNQQVSHFYVLP